MFPFWQIKIGVILEMSHPVLLKTTLQALLVSKWAPKSKASEVDLIIIINEVIDHDYLAWWAGSADLQNILVIISSMSLIHIFVTFTIDYWYLCLYVFSWVHSTACVCAWYLTAFQHFQMSILIHCIYITALCLVTRVSVCCGFDSHCIQKIM